jgi:predicted transposase/invertase (TIGR01784 family)
MSVVKVKEIEDIDWDRMTISNGYLFGELMKNERLCKPMIERLLGINRISRIKWLQNEVVEKPGYLSKGVRLDVCAEDKVGAFYNLEMQKKDTKELPQRARYYNSVMDVTYFKSGSDYADIRNNYVVFICQEDVFGLGYYRYEVKPTISENLEYNNGTHTIFFNTKGYRGEIHPEAKAILDFVEGIGHLY